MLQALRKNFGLKLFSLALAIAGWAFFRFLAGPSIAAPFGERITFGTDPSNTTQRSFAVSIAYTGTAASLVAKDLEVLPASITVTAPRYAVGAIHAVRVDVPIPSVPTTYDAMLAPQVDAPGVASDVFDISPNLVRVRVKFVQSGT